MRRLPNDDIGWFVSKTCEAPPSNDQQGVLRSLATNDSGNRIHRFPRTSLCEKLPRVDFKKGVFVWQARGQLGKILAAASQSPAGQLKGEEMSGGAKKTSG